jgi:hypothetical protein
MMGQGNDIVFVFVFVVVVVVVVVVGKLCVLVQSLEFAWSSIFSGEWAVIDVCYMTLFQYRHLGKHHRFLIQGKVVVAGFSKIIERFFLTC